MKCLICFGSGGLAREVTSLIKEDKKFNNFARYSYCFSTPSLKNDFLFPSISSLPEDFYYVVAIGNPYWRNECIDRLHGNSTINAKPVNIIHSSAYISKSCLIKEDSGIIICPNCSVMNNVQVSGYSFIGPGTIIEHDSNIGQNCTISPNVTICGNVILEDNCCIGASSTLIQRVTIGNSSMIGAHSLINRDIDPFTLAYGVPARPVKRIGPGFKYF